MPQWRPASTHNKALPPAEAAAGEEKCCRACLALRRCFIPFAPLVAEAADGFDAVAGLAELAADGGNVHVDGAIEDGHFVADGGVDDLLAREHASGAGDDE